VNLLELPAASQVVVADGADWIKQQTQRHFLGATCILDWPHLWRAEVQQANALLVQWQAEPGGTSVEALQKAITYLRTQRDWIGSYEQWQLQGYPIGSGIIERAVAVVINRRMKKRGMSWLRCNATAVVTLRAAFLNEEWALPTAARTSP
jgi:hypothetical protein